MWWVGVGNVRNVGKCTMCEGVVQVVQVGVLQKVQRCVLGWGGHRVASFPRECVVGVANRGGVGGGGAGGHAGVAAVGPR